MKPSVLPAVLTTCSWFALATVPFAETGTPDVDPFADPDPPPKQLRIQLEFIDVSHEQLTELMLGVKPAPNDTELRQQVATLVKDGKAKVVETMLCLTGNGQKATTESIEEFIYPTEYEPPELPTTLQFKNKEDAEAAKVTRRDLGTGPTPTAFETRNLGSTFEVEPRLSPNGKFIAVRLAPEIVYHVGETVWSEWKDEHGSAPIQMPLMYTVKMNTGAILTAGQYCLVAAVSPKDKDGFVDFNRKLMVFAKGDVLSPGR